VLRNVPSGNWVTSQCPSVCRLFHPLWISIDATTTRNRPKQRGILCVLIPGTTRSGLVQPNVSKWHNSFIVQNTEILRAYGTNCSVTQWKKTKSHRSFKDNFLLPIRTEPLTLCLFRYYLSFSQPDSISWAISATRSPSGAVKRSLIWSLHTS